MKIMWWRIALAGILAEIVYGVFLLLVLGDAAEAYALAGLAGGSAFMLLGGIWVGRRAAAGQVLQGTLVGVVAVLFYMLLFAGAALLMPPPEDPAQLPSAVLASGLFWLNHGLKIAGGAVGGLLGGRLRRGQAPAAP